MSAPNNRDLIAPLKAGSRDTLLSARRANQVIAAANIANHLQGRGRIQVLHADAGITIALLPDNPGIQFLGAVDASGAILSTSVLDTSAPIG